MKITITQEFSTAEEAVAFIARAGGAVCLDPARDAEPEEQQGPLPAAKKPRKPRSDAGQARGEYRHRTTMGEPAALEPGAVRGSASTPTPPAAPATPPASAAPAKSAAVEPPQAPQAPEAADLTLDAVRETLGRLHAVPGKGMTACMAALKAFGVLRISDLPKEKYAEFSKHVLAQLPKEKAA
jgi:hypothetical protein